MSKLVKDVPARKDHSTQRKGWCITTQLTPNVDSQEEKDRFANPAFQYSIYEEEVAPSTGQLHLQGYIHFAKKCRFPAVLRLFPNSHIEGAKGTASQNRVYCAKDGRAIEFGSLPLMVFEQANDKWATCREQAINGDLDEVEPSLLIKYYSTLKRISQDASAQRALPTLDWKTPPNLWIWGPTGRQTVL